MRYSIATIIATILSIGAYCQSSTQPLESFDKIVASQYVNVVLEKGEQESIRLEYHGIDPEDINVKVRRKKLHVYLDRAKLIEKRDKYYQYGNKVRVSRYKNSSVTAYVTYKQLRGIEIRGSEGLTCNSPITTDKFKLKAYGENEISIASLQTNKFKASIYGENTIEIKGGLAGHQVYRLFGENKIDTQNLESNTAISRIYGTGRLTVNASDEFKISAFGEPEIRLTGSAFINKNLILGDPSIKVRR